MEQDNNPKYINEQIDNIENLIIEISTFGFQEKKLDECDPFLKKQLEQIDEIMPRESLTSTIFNFLNNNNKQEKLTSDLSKKSLTHKNYDHIAMECFILENLLDFGMIASLYEIPNMHQIDAEIVDVVTEKGAYHLFEMFHSDERTKYEMINTFVNFYQNEELKRSANLDYLDGTKARLRYEYTEAILECKKIEAEQKKLLPVKNQINEIDFVKFLWNHRNEINLLNTELKLKK